MLEVIIVWNLAKRIGESAAKKGHKALTYQIMLVGFWIAAELSGGLVGSIISYLMWGEEDFSLLGYFLALACAGMSAGIAFFIVKLLPDRSGEPALSDISPFEPPLPPTSLR
jgi:hypothetical protein